MKTPLKGVAEIWQASEKAFHSNYYAQSSIDGYSAFQRFIDLHLQTMVLPTLQCKHIFPTLVDHFNDHELGIETDHIGKLMKTVASFISK